jgi:hypothetical protein
MESQTTQELLRQVAANRAELQNAERQVQAMHMDYEAQKLAGFEKLLLNRIPGARLSSWLTFYQDIEKGTATTESLSALVKALPDAKIFTQIPVDLISPREF